jgi:Protein of unknown function (DUF5818)
MRPTTVVRLLAGLLLAVVLAACAGRDGGAGGAVPTTARETLPAAPTTSTPSPTTAPGGKHRLTATGTVRDGVEPGCVLLEADQGTVYLLVGGDRGKLVAGGRVRVTGLLAPDLLSTCQQGEPLLVSSIKPVP